MSPGPGWRGRQSPAFSTYSWQQQNSVVVVVLLDVALLGGLDGAGVGLDVVRVDLATALERLVTEVEDRAPGVRPPVVVRDDVLDGPRPVLLLSLIHI